MKIVALALGVCLGLARAQEPGAEQLIQRITDEVMTAIQADRELAAGDKDKALKLAEQKVLPYVDFEEATRLAVSRAWLQASAEQKRKLVSEFRAMMLRTYTSAMGAYTGTEPRLLPSRGQARSAEGMSLVLTYRTEFDGILKQEGIDGLISRLAQKNAPPRLAL